MSEPILLTNLAWPEAPYTAAHRPIDTHPRLLSGLSIGLSGWAAVHLPTDRTRALSASTARLGVHVVIGDEDDLNVWTRLELLLLAGRRQAVAIAGDGICAPLTRVERLLAETDHACPAITSILGNWPGPGMDPVKGRKHVAELVELEEQPLTEQAESLLLDWPLPAKLTSPENYPTALAVHAAATAIAAAHLTGRYTIEPDLDLIALLDAAVGDLFPVKHFATLRAGHDWASIP